MPTYEYRCPEGHVFEHFFRKISDGQAELPCPVCGRVGVRQVSGGAGLMFKGSGFYLTDYGRNAHRGSGDSASKAEGGAKGEGGAKPDGGSKGESGPSGGGSKGGSTGGSSGSSSSGGGSE
jgi:putative FmdB family regulatory protein